jgi:hypothetical protein
VWFVGLSESDGRRVTEDLLSWRSGGARVSESRERKEERDGWRGGSGGARGFAAAVLGAVSSVMSGVVAFADGTRERTPGTVAAPVRGFAFAGRGGGAGLVGAGPSGTTQSLRSMSEDLTPSAGGSGDGERECAGGCAANVGAMGECSCRAAVGEIGSSSGFPAGVRPAVGGVVVVVVVVDAGEGARAAPRDSKAWMRDWRDVDAGMAVDGEGKLEWDLAIYLLRSYGFTSQVPLYLPLHFLCFRFALCFYLDESTPSVV